MTDHTNLIERLRFLKGVGDDAADALEALQGEVEMWKATAKAVVDFEKVELRARLSALEGQEPVAWAVIGEDGYDPKDGHRQFIGLSIREPMVFMGSTAAPLFLAAGAAPTGINGLTYEETSNSMSVRGLSKAAPSQYGSEELQARILAKLAAQAAPKEQT